MNICLQMNLFTNEVQSNIEIFVVKFTPDFWTWKHNWQVCNELGTRTMKGDLKSTITTYSILGYLNVTYFHL